MKSGVICESSSPWASPLVYVKKKDGTTRPCVDYRKLNAQTVKDAYPLPNISDCLESLGGSTYFSCLDILSAYYQIEVAEQDRPKTAFVSKYGLFEYNVMPFGLCNAPSTFQRCLELIMRGLQWDIVLIYLDDLIVFSRTFDENLQRLDIVLSRLYEAGLRLKPEKCELFKEEVSFLGHVVSKDGIKPQKSKVSCIVNWQTPTDLTTLRSFLGFCSYYRRFIRDFSSRARPLNRLLEAGQPFEWTKECQNSFNDLKSSLTGDEVMAFPQDDGMFILDCDASDYAVAGVLSQVQFNEQCDEFCERPIAYASKSLNKAQRRYCTTRRELLAVVTFVTMFKQYLLGRSFLIRSDHSSLTWIMSFKNPENQMARWLEVLSQYDFRIEHRKGSKHINADFLSRPPNNPSECDNYDGNTVLRKLPCGGCKDCRRKHEQWSYFNEEVDNVVPLMVKRVTQENTSIRMDSIVMLISVLLMCVKYCFDRIQKLGETFRSCGDYMRGNWNRLPIVRLRAAAREPRSKDVVDDVHINASTQEKDQGLTTHAGGLFPNEDNLQESLVYKFSNWVGSYTKFELQKMQQEDPDIGKILKWISESGARPTRDAVASESPAVAATAHQGWTIVQKICEYR